MAKWNSDAILLSPAELFKLFRTFAGTGYCPYNPHTSEVADESSKQEAKDNVADRAICVFVDARMASNTGIGRYIVGHLSELCGRGFSVIAGVASEHDREVIIAACPSIETVPYDARLYGIKERFLGLRGQKVHDRQIDVYWYPQYNGPLLLPSKSVVTIHDLTQFHFNLDRSLAGFLKRFIAKRILIRAVRQARIVVCVSETTRKELLKWVPQISTKTMIVPNGVAARWGHADDAGLSTVRRATSGLPFLLAVGVKKEHKNHQMLLDVLDRLDNRFPHILVVIGKPEDSWKRAVADWKLRTKRSDRLIDLDVVTDNELAAFYRRASVLLMPSLAEGFGLPPLEAMIAGTPVICSNRGALPETVGNAALLLDPTIAAKWAAEIERLLSDTSLAESLRQAGHVRADQLTWSAASERLRAALRIAAVP